MHKVGGREQQHSFCEISVQNQGKTLLLLNTCLLPQVSGCINKVSAHIHPGQFMLVFLLYQLCQISEIMNCILSCELTKMENWFLHRDQGASRRLPEQKKIWMCF